MKGHTRQARLRIAALGAVCVVWMAGLLVGPVAPAWTSSLQSPNRQTVPMTPPATWTPVVEPGASEPTTSPRPTLLPTVEVQDEVDDEGSSGDGKLGGTPKAQEPTQSPTQEPAAAVPWIEISADTAWIQPDQSVAIRVTLANLGNASLGTLSVQVDVPTGLAMGTMSASAGDIAEGGAGELVWQTPDLAPGQEIALELTVTTAPSLWPGTVYVVQAEISLVDDKHLAAQYQLTSPAAILPQAGK